MKLKDLGLGLESVLGFRVDNLGYRGRGAAAKAKGLGFRV